MPPLSLELYLLSVKALPDLFLANLIRNHSVPSPQITQASFLLNTEPFLLQAFALSSLCLHYWSPALFIAGLFSPSGVISNVTSPLRRVFP